MLAWRIHDILWKASLVSSQYSSVLALSLLSGQLVDNDIFCAVMYSNIQAGWQQERLFYFFLFFYLIFFVCLVEA
jgi:hypothetical protein